MTKILFLSLLLGLSLHVHSQPSKDVKRLLGKWVVLDGSYKGKTIVYGSTKDSLYFMVENKYGSYDTSMVRFPLVPIKQGPKGLYFQIEVMTIDTDGDTVDVSKFIEVTDLHKKDVTFTYGELNRIRTGKYGSSEQWTKEFSDKFDSLIQDSFSVDLKMRRRK